MAADGEATHRSLGLLLDVACLMTEEANELAVAIPPRDPDRLRARIEELRRVGADLIVIADACEVLVRRGARTMPAE